MKVVGIGGGHGLATSLQAARLYSDDVSAVVTVADDGGSSGRLTRELRILPPGDIRNCLVELSENPELAELWQHRFTSGALTGHTVGNLIIAALTERTGDFAEAVEVAGRLLSVKGHVYPATTEKVAMRARVDGGVVKGQVAVAQSRLPIQAVYLEPADPPAYGPAVDAIRAADQIVLGPGSLFTSLIATLLVPGIARALTETSARRVFVCNSRMQKGETEGLSATAHVEALLAHVGPYTVDAVVVQAPVVGDDGVVVDSGALHSLNLEVVEADVARADGGHVPERLAAVLSTLA